MSVEIVYKVLTASEFAALRLGVFQGSPVDLADGFLHLSTAAQLTETVARHFADQRDLIVAAFSVHRLGEALRWEVSRGGQLFPHLYAPLTLAGVLAYGPLRYETDGSVCLPLAPVQGPATKQ
jgi:uncharacterized protein (DUF952 family)